MKFKKFAIGFAIFILTIIFIIFVNKAINPQPSYKSCQPSYNYNNDTKNYNYNYNNDYAYQMCQQTYENNLKAYKEKSFFIVTMLSVLTIIAGVLVRSVIPVSWGLVMAGLVTLLYIFIANFEEIGKPYRAIVSGVALIFLIWIAYAKLGDKGKMAGGNAQPTPSQPIPPTVYPPVPPITGK